MWSHLRAVRAILLKRDTLRDVSVENAMMTVDMGPPNTGRWVRAPSRAWSLLETVFSRVDFLLRELYSKRTWTIMTCRGTFEPGNRSISCTRISTSVNSFRLTAVEAPRFLIYMNRMALQQQRTMNCSGAIHIDNGIIAFRLRLSVVN